MTDWKSSELRCGGARKIVDQFCDVIEARAEKGWNFGVALIPEGLIEFIPAFLSSEAKRVG